METLLAVLVLVAALFLSATFLVPAPAGGAWLLWPFDRTQTDAFTGLGDPLRLVPTWLADFAVLAFGLALLALFGWLVPRGWWRTLVVVGAICSGLLFGLSLGPWAVVPLAIDAGLLWAVLSQGWLPSRTTGGQGHPTGGR